MTLMACLGLTLASACGQTAEPGTRHLRAVFLADRSVSSIETPSSHPRAPEASGEKAGKDSRLVASARKWTVNGTVNGGRVPGSIELVVRALRDAGLRFGTDRTMQSLLAYLRHSHELVTLSQARPGDVVFFDLGRGRGGCGAHAGVVEWVEPGGRVTFIESRDGRVRRSYLHPAHPRTRRDASGMVLNTFLRAKRMDDPGSARYHAADMVCAVGRVR